LISDIQDKNGFGSLGFTLLGILYLFQMVGAVISSAFSARYGIKATLVVGFLFLSSIVASNILSSWRANNEEATPDQSAVYNFLANRNLVITVLIVSSALSGFGQAIVWVAEGEYMSLCATESTKGFYFGYFWSWYMAS
jgi:MFS family permease